MEKQKKDEAIPLMEYLPSVQSLLVAVLSFVAGFLYRRVADAEQVSDAFDEGYEKGAMVVAKALSDELGININIEIGDDEDEIS